MSGPARRPLFVVLSGPSGAGKDAVLDELARRGHRFHRVITCTTRPPRPGERDGADYHFLTDAAFERLVAEDGLLEHATVYGRHYGVPKQQVLDKLAEGLDVYVRTDVQGAASIKRLMPDAVLIFIAPGSLDELEARLRERNTDDDAQIERRMHTAREEMARAGDFNHLIANAAGQLTATVDRLAEVLETERIARQRR